LVINFITIITVIFLKMTKQKIKKTKEVKTVEVKSRTSFLSVSPRKLRLMVKTVKRFAPSEAMRRMKFLNKKTARILTKAIKTAIADAAHNFGLKKETLKFKEILVGEGPRQKRHDYSHGARFNSGIIQKQKAHLTIKIIGEK
jgi:large subunit ribosomal protein L22